MAEKSAYFMFADVKNFSKLDHDGLDAFHQRIWPGAVAHFEPYLDDALAANTWGDALFIVLESPTIVEPILELRDYFRNHREAKRLGLEVRVGCHFASFRTFIDPITRRPDATGPEVSRAARLEPVTRPNEIFVTQTFVDHFLLDADPDIAASVRFDKLGEIPLAKNFGRYEVSRLRREDEDEHVIDRLVRQDLMDAFPDAPDLSTDEEQELDQLKKLPAEELSGRVFSNISGSFRAKLAELYKSKGLYQHSVDLSQELDDVDIQVDGISIYPFRHDVKLKKTRANALTRLGQYDEAAEILYGLWKSGQNDVDTLSMLAAQYKRRATHTADGSLRTDFDRELLARARDLYLEAFRRDISAYYPAINAAYLLVMLGGDDAGKGRLLAQYITQVWKTELGNDWWVSSTIAEAYLINDDFQVARETFSDAIKGCKPPRFELDATRSQIRIYRHFQPGIGADVQGILDVLV